MDASVKTGIVAVFAVSGSAVFLAMQAHNRLHSDFIQKVELQIKNSTGATVKDPPKKKVRFADHAAAEKAQGKKDLSRPAAASSRRKGESLEAMPENWQVMYKGILQYKNRVVIS